MDKSKHVVLALRLTIIFSLVTMIPTLCRDGQYKLADIPFQIYLALAIFFVNTNLGYFRYFNLVSQSLATMFGFVVDIVAMTLFIYYSGTSDAHRFYIVFLIIVLITASIRSVWAAFVTTLVGAVIYGFISTAGPSADPFKEALGGLFLSRVAFLFIVATFIGYLAEETERHQREKVASEEALTTEVKNLTEYLRNVFQSAPGGIIVLDTVDKITVFNKRAEEILGLTAHNTLGQAIWKIPRLKKFHEAMLEFYSARKGDRAEITLARSPEQTVCIGMRFSILYNAAGKRTGTIAVFQDLTEIKRYEKELLARERLAAVGQLASAMAHDFFNTLGGLKGIVELTIDNPTPAQVTETLNITRRGLASALAIVRNLLNFSRKPQPRLEPVVVSDVVNEALALVKHDLDKDGIEVAKKVEDVAAIMSDPNLLQQVFLNLLLNARQAILPNKGAITIEVNNRWDFVQVVVSDSGKGIGSEEQSKIFNPFFTTKSASPKKEGGGLGLGLYVSKEIISALQGSIVVRSEPGRGATFIVKLPLKMK
ncbi:MAG: PAS domain S-box protein [Planctomycetes bacterium]|nr:PAS domain S-box protein [Planctomycetota bacterium]